MDNMMRYESDARYLLSHLVTHWETYDFTEKSDNPEDRVPRITFIGIPGISLVPQKAEYIQGFAYEKFIRKNEVCYRDGKYIFQVIVDVPLGMVREYKVSVYLYTDKELKRLFDARL